MGTSPDSGGHAPPRARRLVTRQRAGGVLVVSSFLLAGPALAEEADPPPAAPAAPPAPDPGAPPAPAPAAPRGPHRRHDAGPRSDDLVHVVPIFTVATTTRNLSFGGRMSVGHELGPAFTLTLAGDWLLSGLVAGFLLDDLGSPRFVGSEVASWTFAWPGTAAAPPVVRRWLPRVSLGVGLWETAEVDSLLQSFRTEDYGLYLADSLGGQVGLLFPYVRLAFGLRPFGSSLYLREGREYPTDFQFTNAVLDVDVSLDLAQLWRAGRPQTAP